jgi:hypothetical protein
VVPDGTARFAQVHVQNAKITEDFTFFFSVIDLAGNN